MRFGLLAALLLGLSSCKKGPEPVTKEGWYKPEADPKTGAGWAGQCFFPKNFANLGPGDRKVARQAALEAMVEQWSGKRNDGVSFDETVVENVETVLLGRPEAIESVAQQNAEHCETYMAGGAQDSGAWSSWLSSLPGKLTEGECNHPLVDTIFNYISVNSTWQNPASVCPGDEVEVTASAIDYYKISPSGPWINAAGDPNLPTVGKSEFPCNIEGCLQGMVVLRFRSDDGFTEVVPVGLKTIWKAPGSGKIDVMINDDNLSDNKFKIESGLEHHTSITYEPAE